MSADLVVECCLQVHEDLCVYKQFMYVSRRLSKMAALLFKRANAKKRENILSLCASNYKRFCEQYYKRCIPLKEHIACELCYRIFKDAHLYVKLRKERRHRFIYPLGCMHIDYDGEPWCDSCMTVTYDSANRMIVTCTKCAGLDWGRVRNKRTKYVPLEEILTAI